MNSSASTRLPPRTRCRRSFTRPIKRRDFARGFAIQTVGPLPVAFAKQMVAAMGAWGWGMRRVMMDYNHWATLGVLGEILPWQDNRVELAEEKDQAWPVVSPRSPSIFTTTTRS